MWQLTRAWFWPQSMDYSILYRRNWYMTLASVVSYFGPSNKNNSNWIQNFQVHRWILLGLKAHPYCLTPSKVEKAVTVSKWDSRNIILKRTNSINGRGRKDDCLLPRNGKLENTCVSQTEKHANTTLLHHLCRNRYNCFLVLEIVTNWFLARTITKYYCFTKRKWSK